MTDLIAPQRSEDVVDENGVSRLRFAKYLEDIATAINELQASVEDLEDRVTTLEGFH